MRWGGGFFLAPASTPPPDDSDASQNLRAPELECVNIFSFLPFVQVSGLLIADTEVHVFPFLSKYLCTSVRFHVLCQLLRPGGMAQKK